MVLGSEGRKDSRLTGPSPEGEFHSIWICKGLSLLPCGCYHPLGAGDEGPVCWEAGSLVKKSSV